MTKVNLTLRMDKQVIKKAKQAGLCISTFLQVKLCEYFAQSKVVGLSEFESESLAPKAKRMNQATLQAQKPDRETFMDI
ncbi:MAG: hypothetical protein Q8898_17230 [Bacillota bacterium]|nr:hypothetical protein [Bacillota bacterium]